MNKRILELLRLQWGSGCDEENLSTEQYQQKADTWILEENEYETGTDDNKKAPGKREAQTGGIAMAQPSKGEGLCRDERLRYKKDFERVFKEGARRDTKHFVVISRKNDLGFSRIGAVARKRIGKAVQRNRVKRLIREFFRRYKYALPASTDYIILGKDGAVELHFAHVVEELKVLANVGKHGESRDGEGTR